jgi:hypothetical protein
MNKKTKFFAISLTALALFIGVQSNAQSIQKSKLRFGIGVDGLCLSVIYPTLPILA